MEAQESLSATAAAAAAAVQGAASGRGMDRQADGESGGACELARDAAALFQGGHFAECVDMLHQILQKKGEDPKVLHNIAIAEYFRDGCSDPRKLVDLLDKVKKKTNEPAYASREHMEVASSFVSGSKGSGDTFTSANSASIPYADILDTSIATLNIATALYRLHEYAHALSLLEPLYQRLHPLDETTALRICLLLIDISLASNDASRAADVIQHLEKSFGIGYTTNLGDSGNILQQQSSSQTSKITTVPCVLAVPDASSDSCTSSNASEIALDRTLSEYAIEYENLLSTLGSSGENITRSSINDIPRASADWSASAVDLKLKIHLYKVQLLLLTRNLKAAKREIKLIMNVARERDSSTALLLKSQLEYARGNYRKAIKLLMTSSNRTEPGILSMFNNNLGCIYHQLYKHHTSAVLFSQALRRSPLKLEKPLKLSTFSQDKSLFVLYNCGLQYLACGKPLIAARCFREASPIFYNRPLLWLRLAECCLLALENGLLKPKDSSLSFGNEQAKLHVVGLGKWRRLLLDMNGRHGHISSSCDRAPWSDKDQSRVSIPFARQCLLNVLYLLNEFEKRQSIVSPQMSALEVDFNTTSTNGINHRSAQAGEVKTSNTMLISASLSANGDSRESKGCAGQNTTLQSSLSAYEEICRKENHMIKQAALADLAYVELSLENYLRALNAAKALQQLPDCSRAYVFLGCVYAAEALCYLNRTDEAAAYLSVYISQGNTIDIPYSEDDRDNWILQKVNDGEEPNGSGAAKISSPEELKGNMFLRPEEARGMLYVNLAAVSSMQGDLEQAKLFVTEALLAVPNNPQALLAAVYVDLRLGNTSDALFKLKQCCKVRFFRSGVKLSS